MAIVATPGSATANSYVTVAEATAYLVDRLNNSAWQTAINEAKEEAALIQATFRIDQYDYIGDRATTTQALQWPRITNDFYDLDHDVFPFTSTEIPVNIKKAQMELALALLAAGGESTSSELGAVQEINMGGSFKVKLANSSTVVDTSVDRSGLPIQAARFLKGLRLIPVLA